MLGAGGYQDQIVGVVEYLSQAVALELRLSLCLSRSGRQFAEFGLASAPLRKVADAGDKRCRPVELDARDANCNRNLGIIRASGPGLNWTARLILVGGQRASKTAQVPV